MPVDMKCGALTISGLALLCLFATPAAAQWHYYYGYQGNPPTTQAPQDYSAYPAFPGEEQGQPGYAYGQPGQPGNGQPGYAQPGYAYGQPGQPGNGQPGYAQPGYGEPQPAPPGQGAGTSVPAGGTVDGVYNAPPDDAAAAASGSTRQEVDYPSTEAPGTIIVDTNSKHLYYIEAGGKAIQYGIGVGREGFAWSGVATVGSKQEWPKWFPPEAMLQRRPDLPIEMDGGLGNPLGARAMYLYQGKVDTQYRIHGTNEPDSIGQAVSSGCIRMMNADVMDLYNRVPIGTKVIVE
jgi:lipoprotein-anchoring transpeptidase ErfK/SrfK